VGLLHFKGPYSCDKVPDGVQANAWAAFKKCIEEPKEKGGKGR
jgi:hypothetical protein